MSTCYADHAQISRGDDATTPHALPLFILTKFLQEMKEFRPRGAIEDPRFRNLRHLGPRGPKATH